MKSSLPNRKWNLSEKGGKKKRHNSTLLQICQNFTNSNSDISQTTKQKQEYTTYLTQLSSRETVHLGVCFEEPDSESTNYLKTTNFRNFCNHYPMLSFLQNLDDEIPGLRFCYLREISWSARVTQSESCAGVPRELAQLLRRRKRWTSCISRRCFSHTARFFPCGKNREPSD